MILRFLWRWSERRRAAKREQFLRICRAFHPVYGKGPPPSPSDDVRALIRDEVSRAISGGAADRALRGRFGFGPPVS